MKNYFKMFLTAAVLLVSVNSYALLPVSFGIKGGVNLSNLGGDVKNTDAKAGFHAGLIMDVDLPLTNFGIITGLEFTTKGAKYNVEAGDSNIKFTTNASYLQLPAHLSYKIGIAPATKLVFHGGPYFAYGIGGKIKYSGGKSDTFDDDGFKRFDFGLGIGAGVQLWKFGIDLGWDYGLTNVSNTSDRDVKNRNAYLSFSYRFM